MVKRILLIDDSYTEFIWLWELLKKREDVSLEHAYNLELAKKLLLHESFDIIIIDMNLNNQNGYDVYNELRGNNALFIITSELLRHRDGVSIESNALVVSKNQLDKEINLILNGKARWKQTDLKTIKSEH